MFLRTYYLRNTKYLSKCNLIKRKGNWHSSYLQNKNQTHR